MKLISGKDLKIINPNCKILRNADHVVGGNEICDLFCKKYHMYNSVSYRQDDLNEVKSKMF